MLVEIYRGVILKGYSTLIKREHWYSKGKKERYQIKLNTGIRGICDESEIESTIDKLLKMEMKDPGWGENFEGWTDYEWRYDLKVTYIKDMKMKEIIEKLTGEQFKNEFGFNKP